MARRSAKENACLIALQYGFHLVVRETGIWGIRPDGSTFLLCKPKSLLEVWSKAEAVLLRMKDKALLYKYRMVTPSGFYVGDTIWDLIKNYLTGRRMEIPKETA